MMHLLAWLILLLAILGHLVIVRAILNRGYELGLPQRLWQLLVALLILAAVAGPLLIVGYVGLDGAAILRGGAWSNVALPWLLYVVACALALVVGAVVLIRRAKDAAVAAQLASKSEVLQYTTALGARPACSGVLGRIARLPGNQIFSVEIVQREIALPRLPAQWDGLTILHITDLHMNGTPDRGFFEWATDRCAQLRCDIATMTGDVMDNLDVIEWLPTTLGKLDAPLGRCFVLGNHDLHAGGEAMRAAMESLGWTSVAGRVISREYRGARLVIGGTETPWAGELPAINAAVAPQDFRILLSHAPHLIHWARAQNFDLVLAGHLHGGQIQWPLIGPVAGGRFHSGLFHLPPTLMHVGRGLGQMAPIRWGCRPEITRLVLRPASPEDPAPA